MNIVQVAECFAYGTAKSVKQLVGILKDKQEDGLHKITVFYGDRDGTAVEQQELDPSVQWVKLPGGHLKNFLFLLRHISHDVDVIHGHSSFGGAYVKALGLFRRKSRILYSPRGYSFLRLDLPWIARKAFWMFERVSSGLCETVACGPSELHHAKAMCPQRSFHIGNGWRIPNHVDTDTIGDGVVTVGRISIQKGFDHFLKIARALPHVHFDWIGSAEVGQESLAEDVPSNVTITNYMPHSEVLEKIRSARFVFLPSRWEGLSRFLVESVCMGKAIITSDCPANVDCLVPDKNGGFRNGFKCATTEDYVAAIEKLLNDDELVRDMQDVSFEYAKRDFDIEAISKQWRSFYAQDAKDSSGNLSAALETPNASSPRFPSIGDEFVGPQESSVRI